MGNNPDEFRGEEGTPKRAHRGAFPGLEEAWKRLPQYFPSELRRRVSGRDHQSRTKRPSSVHPFGESNMSGDKRKPKPAYHGGRQAAVRFESAMRKILSVPKD